MNLAAEQQRAAVGDARAPAFTPPANAWESALQAWETVLDLAPDHPVARLQQIECLIRLKRWDEVVGACAALGSRLAVGDEIRFARKLMSGQAFAAALELWQLIVVRAENDEQALTAIRAQLRCFARLGLRGRKPKVDTCASPFGNSAARRRTNAGPRHVAILGVSYCGSTLLSLVLGALPGVANIGESHWLVEPRTGKERRSHNLTVDGFEQCVFCGSECPVITDDLRRRLAARPAAFHQILAAALGTDILVSADKNYPHLVRRDPDLHHDAIVLFRDPLRNWCSHARRSGSSDADARQRYLDNWTMDYSNFLNNYPNSGRKIVLDFDAFLLRPEPMLRELCRALDLPFAAGALEYWRRPQHCVGGNVDLRNRLAGDDRAALRVAPETTDPRPDPLDDAVFAEVLAITERLRAAALRAAP